MADNDTELQHDTEAFERAFERPPPKRSPRAEPPDKGDDDGGDDAGAAAADEHREPHSDRDERGRFKKRDGGDEGEGDEGEGGGDQSGDREAIPAWRLREVAEERRQLREQMATLQRERDEARQRAAAYERQQREARRQQERPDFLTDPKGYHDWMEEERRQMREEFRNERRNERINESFDAVREGDPQRFDRAFQTLCRAGEAGDPIFERVRNAPNPGKSLMKWFGDLEVLHEIGGDLGKFREKEAERLMSDPEFRKRAMETWRGQAENGDGRERPSGRRNLPSLNRVTGSSVEIDDEPRDDSESFNRAFDPRPTRRRRAG